ncbi:DUF4372 domain-containing protein [Algoriphagus sp. D3-2-R+10]|uniref:DUF4372 domain-containing protein n=1 Tax=Algoriphagus aurantiacus TaxID=3103948 RepID=UPI003A5CF9E4
MQRTTLSGHPIISQLLSFIPQELVDKLRKHFSPTDINKTISTYKQLVFMVYGIVYKAQSLNSLCNCRLVLGQKLNYLGIDRLLLAVRFRMPTVSAPMRFSVICITCFWLITERRFRTATSVCPSTGKFPLTG